MRLDRYLGDHLPGAPISLLQRLLRTGQVRVNGGRARGGDRLRAGDEVRLPPIRLQPVQEGNVVVPPPLQKRIRQAIVWRDEQVLVLDKPAGLAVHGGSGGKWGAIDLLRAVLAAESGTGGDPGNGRPELCHRLDKGTSGCLLFGLNRTAVRWLTAAFREGRVEKTYQALVRGRPRPGTGIIDRPLLKGVMRGGERMVVAADGEGAAAVTRYDLGESFSTASLMTVRPESGRTHQIRAHFQWLGHPLAGDEKYGDRHFNRAMKRIGLNRLFLHAQRLVFPHPDGGAPFSVSAPLEPSLQRLLTALRRDGER